MVCSVWLLSWLSKSHVLLRTVNLGIILFSSLFICLILNIDVSIYEDYSISMHYAKCVKWFHSCNETFMFSIASLFWSYLQSYTVTETQLFKIKDELPSNQCGYTKSSKYGILAILQPGTKLVQCIVLFTLFIFIYFFKKILLHFKVSVDTKFNDRFSLIVFTQKHQCYLHVNSIHYFASNCRFNTPFC